jgi:cytoskeletal protein RodZ
MSGQRGGKPSAAVYRRRRLVALVLAVIVVALLVWGVVSIFGALRGGDDPTSTGAVPSPTETAQPDATASEAEPTESPEATASATPEPTDDTPAVCGEGDVTVTAITDAATYAADALPQLSMKLVNTSDTPCRMDVGTSAQIYTIKSGDDTIWTSTDCQSDGTSQVVELTPGKEVTSPAIEWVRERSTTDTCESDSRPAAVGGGAYYSLTVSIGGISSEPVFFELQ